MSNPGRGGRGKSAPYSTIHYRIPEPIKPFVERFAATYRNLVSNKYDCEQFLNKVDVALNNSDQDKNQLTIHEAIIAKLEIELADAKKQVETLQEERKVIAEALVSTLEFKPQQGRKIQEVIKHILSKLSK